MRFSSLIFVVLLLSSKSASQQIEPTGVSVPQQPIDSCWKVNPGPAPDVVQLEAQFLIDLSFDENIYVFSLCNFDVQNKPFLVVESLPKSFSAAIDYTAREIPNELTQIQSRETIQESWLVAVEEAVFNQLINLASLTFSQAHEDIRRGTDGSVWCVSFGDLYDVYNRAERVCYWSPRYNTEAREIEAMLELGQMLWQLAEFESRGKRLY